MGCDIHTMLEFDGKRWNGDAWVPAGWVTSKVPCFPYPYTAYRDNWDNENQPYSTSPLLGRDYELFAMLADVRNDGSITPLAEPRGVPDDASKGWRKYNKQWDGDLHSQTYFTLAELEEALEAGHFRQAIEQRGVISALQYRRLVEWGQVPSSWSRSIGGGGIKVGEPDDVAHLVQPKPKRPAIAVPDDVPPMPGESPRQPAPDDGFEPEPEPLVFVRATDPADKLGGFTHIQAVWQRVTDRERPIRDLIAIAQNFAPKIGPKPDWGKPDERPRDLTKVRIMIGFDN